MPNKAVRAAATGMPTNIVRFPRGSERTLIDASLALAAAFPSTRIANGLPLIEEVLKSLAKDDEAYRAEVEAMADDDILFRHDKALAELGDELDRMAKLIAVLRRRTRSTATQLANKTIFLKSRESATISAK